MYVEEKYSSIVRFRYCRGYVGSKIIMIIIIPLSHRDFNTRRVNWDYRLGDSDWIKIVLTFYKEIRKMTFIGVVV